MDLVNKYIEKVAPPIQEVLAYIVVETNTFSYT